MTRKPTRGVLALLTLLATAACKHTEPPPPKSGAFSISDKFFDVKALGDGKFVMLGYRSKILRTEDSGATWKPVAQPMQRSLARLTFVDDAKGWGIGHQGRIFATTDGGLNWTEQKSGTELSLFDADFPTPQRGYAVGDGSSIVMTSDGGATWTAGKIEMSMIGVREDMSLAIEDPIFYSVDCLDENTCWVTGEFGQIRLTEDGGKTWTAQHESLLGG
ncbi:MAG: WD40/YVTN/BNR-like repeat-containing protein, partial [Candidatus Binatia bacterium]